MALRVYVVDNGGQWTHREWRVLKYLGAEAKIVPNTTPLEQLRDADGLVLSGGAPRIGIGHSLGNCAEYLDQDRVPVLGICAGHQFMATHFGGAAAPGATPEFGTAEVERDAPDDTIFHGLPPKFTAWESHNDEVAVLPKGFIKLAHSAACQVQAMKHQSRPLFGIQFHPEVQHTEHGEQIFRNFLAICEQLRAQHARA